MWSSSVIVAVLQQDHLLRIPQLTSDCCIVGIRIALQTISLRCIEAPYLIPKFDRFSFDILFGWMLTVTWNHWFVDTKLFFHLECLYKFLFNHIIKWSHFCQLALLLKIMIICLMQVPKHLMKLVSGHQIGYCTI